MKRTTKLTLMLLFATLACFTGAGLALAAEAVAATANAGGSLLDLVVANKAVLLTALLAVSEVLALIPGIKANSIFQALLNGLKAMTGTDTDPPAGR